MEKEWIVWSSELGTVESAVITEIRPGKFGMVGRLAARLQDMIGRNKVRELDSRGCIEVGVYKVMSPEYWRVNEMRLRQKYEAKVPLRTCLGLPATGRITLDRINQAFRQAAKRAHPDRGGDAATFDALVKARNALVVDVKERDRWSFSSGDSRARAA